MSTDHLKLLARQFYTAIDADQMRSTPAVVSPAFNVHLPGMPPMDWTAFQQFGQGFFAAFGLQHAIESQVAEGETVVNQMIARGTHQQAFQGIAPTGKAVSFAAISIQRFAAGLLVEQHLLIDTLGLLQQIGAVPMPEQVSA